MTRHQPFGIEIDDIDPGSALAAATFRYLADLHDLETKFEVSANELRQAFLAATAGIQGSAE